MRKLLFALILIPGFGLSVQERPDFILSGSGANSVVVEVPGMSAKQLYDKARLFIIKSYKNPNQVISADTSGELLRYTGGDFYKGQMWAEGAYEFVCDLEFKDGRYKVSYPKLSSTANPDATPAEMFKENGELKKRNHYERRKQNYEDLMNQNHERLKAFMLAPPEKW